MPRQAKAKTHLSAAVILVDGSGRILLQLRDDNPEILFPNHWGITGGAARRGETMEQVARREVKEETGIVLEEFQPFRVYETTLDDTTHYTTQVYYAVTERSVDQMAIGEGQELRFFRPHELDALPLAYRHRDMLADFIASEAYQSCLSLENQALTRFRLALTGGADWFSALLDAIARWDVAEEQVNGRHYRYLIGGEAFDWLLLAERLCEEVDGAIPADEREALLFFGRPPRELEAEEFKQAIGDAKHRAHLNFLYGVAVEEALQLTIEEEVLKEHRCRAWSQGEGLEQQVFERIYGRGREEMLAAYREERGLPFPEELSYSELREFTYWLFKYRVNQGDPARVASDTRKALAQISELEAAARRRAQRLGAPDVDVAAVVDGEVVAHVR